MTVVRRTLALAASGALSLFAGRPGQRFDRRWWRASLGVPRPRSRRRRQARRRSSRQRPRPGARQGHSPDGSRPSAIRQGPRAERFSVTVPVYWHAVTDGAAGAVTNAQINGQLSAINRGFSGDEGGADAGFQFSLAGVTRTNNAVWYQSQSAGAEHDMKHTLKQGRGQRPQRLLDERGRLPRLCLPARDHRHRPGLSRRHRDRLADDARRLDRVRRRRR